MTVNTRWGGGGGGFEKYQERRHNFMNNAIFRASAIFKETMICCVPNVRGKIN